MKSIVESTAIQKLIICFRQCRVVFFCPHEQKES